jgi:ribosome-binding factor A
MLQREVKDPRLKDVRVSEVDVSGDLGVARIFYAPLDPNADLAPIESALASASSFMRTRVGKEARLRRVPELRFELDKSAREGFRISQLIDRSVKSSKDGPEQE